MALSGHISGWRRIFRRILGRPHARARVRPAVSAITDIIIIYRTRRSPVELKITRFEPCLRGPFAKPCMQPGLLFNNRTNVMQRCCNSNATQRCTSTCTAYSTTTVANIATHLDYNYSRFCNKLAYTAESFHPQAQREDVLMDASLFNNSWTSSGGETWCNLGMCDWYFARLYTYLI